MGSKIRNARKSFNWKLIIAGTNEFLVQNVKLPEQETEVVEHGDTNHNVGTPGKIKWSDFEMEKILSHLQSDKFAWNWLTSGQDAELGGGDPSQYERVVTLLELAPNGVTVLDTHIITCWVKKVSKGKHSRVDSAENIIEKIVCHVNAYKMD